MKNKIHIPGPESIRPNELIIALGPLGLLITDQHALNTQTRALDILHGTPALTRQQVETDYAVAVDMRMEGDGARGRGGADEDDFRCFDRVRCAEGELQAVRVVCVHWMRGGDRDVHCPDLEVGGGYQSDARGEGAGVEFG